jgi:hypothetical protein
VVENVSLARSELGGPHSLRLALEAVAEVKLVTGILKWPLIIAALFVFVRVLVERSGDHDKLANLLSVVALHFLIVPIYIAIRLARNGVPEPYGKLIRLIALYVGLTRAMLLPIYWLARIYDWPQGRFGGLAGATWFTGYITIPFATAAFWIIASIVFGGLLGSIIIAITRRFILKPTTTGNDANLGPFV